jgi:hypothetical protein
MLAEDSEGSAGTGASPAGDGVSDIIFKMKDGTTREFTHEGRPGGSYTKRLAVVLLRQSATLSVFGGYRCYEFPNRAVGVLPELDGSGAAVKKEEGCELLRQKAANRARYRFGRPGHERFPLRP